MNSSLKIRKVLENRAGVITEADAAQNRRIDPCGRLVVPLAMFKSE